MGCRRAGGYESRKAEPVGKRGREEALTLISIRRGDHKVSLSCAKNKYRSLPCLWQTVSSDQLKMGTKIVLSVTRTLPSC